MAKLAANSVEDFLAKAAKKWGKGHTGVTVATPGYTMGTFDDGQVSKLKFTLDVSSDYAEVGGGSPDANGKKAIRIVAEVAKEHEDRHAGYCYDSFRMWKPDDHAEKVMVTIFDKKATAIKAIEAKLAEVRKRMQEACLDAHKRDGLLWVVKKDDGSYDVLTKPEGAAGCK